MRTTYIYLLIIIVCSTIINGCKDNSVASDVLSPVLYGEVFDSQGKPVDGVHIHYIFEIPGREGMNSSVSSIFKSGKTCPSTNILFTISKRSKVTLIIFRWYTRDTIGTIIDDTLDSGTYTRTFDPSKLTNGFYFYQLKVDTSVQDKIMFLLNLDLSTLVTTVPLTKTNSSGSFELPYALLGFGIPLSYSSADGQTIDTVQISSTIQVVLCKEGYSTLTKSITINPTIGMRQSFTLQKQ